MRRPVTAFGLSLCLAISPLAAIADTPPTDPEVLKGIKLVDDGDFDAAILTLDGAARRLAADPKMARELSQAYLYLGIAYVGKGHEAAAKAKFREALTQIKDITLSPEKFPPKVIDVFEAARSEAAQNAKASAPAPAAAAEKKKGSSKGLLIGLGVAAAAGVGIAAAAGGGGSDTPSTSTPASTRRTETFSGTLNTDEIRRTYAVAVNGPGSLDATATWTDSASVLNLNLLDSGFAPVGPSANRTANTTLTLVPQQVTQGTYNVEIEYSTCNGAAVGSAHPPVGKAARPECTTNFTLTVVHP